MYCVTVFTVFCTIPIRERVSIALCTINLFTKNLQVITVSPPLFVDVSTLDYATINYLMQA